MYNTSVKIIIEREVHVQGVRVGVQTRENVQKICPSNLKRYKLKFICSFNRDRRITVSSFT